MSQVLERGSGVLAVLEKTLESGVVRNGDSAWLSALRKEALADFLKTGFPSRQNEAWRFSDLSPISGAPFSLSEATGTVSMEEARRALSIWLPARMVFIDGAFSSELSALPRGAGVRVQSLAAALRADPQGLEKILRPIAEPGQELSRLNAALFRDGVHFQMEPGAALDAPLQIAFVWSAQARERMIHPLVVIEVGARSQAAIIEESASLSAGPLWRNRAAVIHVADNARVDYCQIQNGSSGGARSYETTSLFARVFAQGRFCSRALTLGGALSRNDAEISLEGSESECVLDGLYMARGGERVDTHTLIRHKAPRGVSRELYKGVLSGDAKAAFRGIIEVDPNAQKTDAMVYNKNLLLSEKGWVNTKPEFRISANDVQCRHGSTIGRLSADALFYLRSRGLSPDAAREFLVRAFAREMLEPLEPEALRAALEERLPVFSRSGDEHA